MAGVGARVKAEKISRVGLVVRVQEVDTGELLLSLRALKKTLPSLSFRRSTKRFCQRL